MLQQSKTQGLQVLLNTAITAHSLHTENIQYILNYCAAASSMENNLIII